MTNLVLFLNALMSYLLVFFVSVAAMGLAIFIGIKTRQSRDAKEMAFVKVENRTDSEQSDSSR